MSSKKYKVIVNRCGIINFTVVSNKAYSVAMDLLRRYAYCLSQSDMVAPVGDVEYAGEIMSHRFTFNDHYEWLLEMIEEYRPHYLRNFGKLGPSDLGELCMHVTPDTIVMIFAIHEHVKPVRGSDEQYINTGYGQISFVRENMKGVMENRVIHQSLGTDLSAVEKYTAAEIKENSKLLW